MPHCRVLPPGEFNSMLPIPLLIYTESCHSFPGLLQRLHLDSNWTTALYKSFTYLHTYTVTDTHDQKAQIPRCLYIHFYSSSDSREKKIKTAQNRETQQDKYTSK